MAKKHAKKVVDKKFMNDLADEIYNPSTKKYLRLCTGTLRNGPDPVDEDRPMHCGLGELYFKMTNRQPNLSKITEDDVVEECIKRSTIDPDGRAEKKERNLRKTLNEELRKLSLTEGQICCMVDAAVMELDPMEFEDKATEFRRLLSEIPNVNDETGDKCEDGVVCHAKDFQARAKAVAKILREAADLLPE